MNKQEFYRAFKAQSSQRLGQFFCNMYKVPPNLYFIDGVDLFHATDEAKVKEYINLTFIDWQLN